MAKILITGANRGIGLELCRQLSERGDEVIATCRRSNAELNALPVRPIERVDVADEQSISSLANALEGERIDVLINNAGILSSETLSDLNFQSMRQQYEVNTLGPLRVTSALLANLGEGSKVVILSSRVGSLADNSSGGLFGYRMSKAAVNMAGVNLAIDLRGRGIAVALFHPGMVATEMTGRQGIPISNSVRGLVARLDELTLSESGKFWHAEGGELPW